MQAQVLFQLSFFPRISNSQFTILPNLCLPNRKLTFVCRSKKLEDEVLAGLPKEFHDEEWQAQQREKTKELERLRQEEDEEEERIVDEYREIGMLLKNYPQEDVFKAKKLVSSFIKSAEEVEEKIEEAAEKGELTELVLMVIWTRLDLARRDEEKDVIRSLDLLYRRVETEILKRQASPAMRLLNDLLIMHDGFDDDGWLKACKKRMVETFPREDPFSLLVPSGFDLDKHHGPLARPAMEADDLLLRIDFIREVDSLLKEVRSPETGDSNIEALDPQSVANRLKEQEKKKVIRQVEALLDLAIKLSW
ncbi:protein PALE CRESS, chloroplastic [Rutidosis leptorrhynchoides]|uniref:protein PALE CRESS, chloroplastic n=1 Tax=Rutidosis leptorrhynchoides TaxID=125765 RepID=UPI003A994A2D